MNLPTTADVGSLASAVRGPVLTQESPDFAQEIAPFNVAIRHTPAVVVGALDEADVAQTVRWAARLGLPVGVQATGHGAYEACDRGVLISTKRLQDLQLDPHRSLARIGAGVRWRTVIDAAAPYGLAPLNGSSSDVGAVGYTLGGGLPVLGRTYGFASDFVREFQIVTADGNVRTVSEQQEPELFWALRGGKASIGVVTSMTIELLPVSTVYGGCIFFDGELTHRLLDAYRTWSAGLPPSTTTALKLLRLPPLPEVPEPLRGKLSVQLSVAHVGDAVEGARLLQPMREVAPALLDDVREIPYSAVDSVHRDPEHPLPFDGRSELLCELSPDTIHAILSVAGPQVDSPLLMVELRHLGGALARSPRVSDAVGSRDAAYSVFLLGVLSPPIADSIPQALEAAEAAIKPHATGHTFVNMHGSPLSVEDRARPWSTDVYNRLVGIKEAHDPHETFRFVNALSNPIPMSQTTV